MNQCLSLSMSDSEVSAADMILDNLPHARCVKLYFSASISSQEAIYAYHLLEVDSSIILDDIISTDLT